MHLPSVGAAIPHCSNINSTFASTSITAGSAKAPPPIVKMERQSLNYKRGPRGGCFLPGSSSDKPRQASICGGSLPLTTCIYSPPWSKSKQLGTRRARESSAEARITLAAHCWLAALSCWLLCLAQFVVALCQAQVSVGLRQFSENQTVWYTPWPWVTEFCTEMTLESLDLLYKSSKSTQRRWHWLIPHIQARGLNFTWGWAGIH